MKYMYFLRLKHILFHDKLNIKLEPDKTSISVTVSSPKLPNLLGFGLVSVTAVTRISVSVTAVTRILVSAWFRLRP